MNGFYVSSDAPIADSVPKGDWGLGLGRWGRLGSNIISVCIRIIQKPLRFSAFSSALSALKKTYYAKVNGFDLIPPSPSSSPSIPITLHTA